MKTLLTILFALCLARYAFGQATPMPPFPPNEPSYVPPIANYSFMAPFNYYATNANAALAFIGGINTTNATNIFNSLSTGITNSYMVTFSPSGTNVDLVSNVLFGPFPSLTYDTNSVGIHAAGVPAARGEYAQISGLNGTWTNLAGNGSAIVYMNPTYFLQTNNISLYSTPSLLPNSVWVNVIGTTAVPTNSGFGYRFNFAGFFPTNFNVGGVVGIIPMLSLDTTKVLTNNETAPVAVDAANANTNTFGGKLTILGSSVQEGSGTTVPGGFAHSEGNATTASGTSSHSEGNSTTASGNTSHAEGSFSIASGNVSHAEGQGAQATNDNSHVGSDGTTIGSGTNRTWTGFYRNGYYLEGGQLHGDGGGLTNISVAGVPSIITNLAIAEAFTNGTFVVNGVQFQTNPASVIQAAFDQMPTYPTKSRAGGGTLYLQSGIYDLTNTIVLTNNNIMNWTIVGQGNNSTIIKANGKYEAIHQDSISTNDANLNLILEHLAVVNSTNCQTNLIYTAHVSKNIFNDCIFSDWGAWTNNGLTTSAPGTLGVQPGLSGTTPLNYAPGLIGIYDAGSQGDRYMVEYCTFNALAVGFENRSDHTEVWHCDFSVISQYVMASSVQNGNSWPSTSIRSVGYAIASFAGITQLQNWFPYYFEVGGAGVGGQVIEHYGAYEGSGGGGALVFNNGTTPSVNGTAPILQDDINGTANGFEYAATNASGVWTNTGGFLSGPNVAVGFNGPNWGSWSSDSSLTEICGIDAVTGFFTGNGSLLTSLNASALSSGTVPVARLGLSIIQTNFIGGKLYVNTYGAPLQVTANSSLAGAAVTGTTCLGLWIVAAPANGGITNLSAVQTTALSIVESYTNVISGYIPTNAIFGFTNLSTGAGNTAVPLGGQIFVY